MNRPAWVLLVSCAITAVVFISVLFIHPAATFPMFVGFCLAWWMAVAVVAANENEKRGRDDA